MQVSLLGSGTKMKAPIFLFHLQYEDMWYINSSVLSQPTKIEELGEEGFVGGFYVCFRAFFLVVCFFVFLFFYFGKQSLCVWNVVIGDLSNTVLTQLM